jgi:orotidine-5'-phosphate decarboxylase
VRREAGGGFVIVTPGIRPAGAGRNDQRRVATPAEAVAEGADYVVVGRPVLAAADPAAAARAIVEEMERAEVTR